MSPYISRQELSDFCYSVVDKLLPFFILALDPIEKVVRVCPALGTADNKTLLQCSLDPCR